MENFVGIISRVLNIGLAGLIFGSFEIVLVQQAYEHLSTAEKCNAICNIFINLFNTSIVLIFALQRYITNNRSSRQQQFKKNMLAIVSILQLIAQLLFISGVMLSPKGIHLYYGLQIVQTCSYGFLICNYYSSCQIIVKFIRAHRIISRFFKVQMLILMSYWCFGVGSYFLYEVMVLSQTNRGFLATIFCFLAFKMVYSLQKTFDFLNFLWIPAFVIPCSIFLNSLIQLHFLQQNKHFFFKKAVLLEFPIIVGFIIIQGIKTYRQFFSLINQLKKLKERRDEIVKFQKRLQKRKFNIESPPDTIQNTSLSTVIDKQWECNICIFGITNQKSIVRLKCNHTFHEGCIKSWTKVKFSCPTCRKEYEDIV